MSEFIDRETWEARAWYYDAIPHKYITVTILTAEGK